MTHYTNDNTEGYTESELARLNERYAEETAGIDDEDELQGISERVLRDYDSGR